MKPINLELLDELYCIVDKWKKDNPIHGDGRWEFGHMAGMEKAAEELKDILERYI